MPPAHLGFALIKVELVAAIKLASMIVSHCRIVMLAAHAEMFFNGLADMVTQAECFSRRWRNHDRCLIMDQVADYLYPRTVSNGGYFDQGLDSLDTQRLSVQQQVNAQ